MKELKKYIMYFRYIPAIVRFFWNRDPLYVISLCLEAFLLAIEPFPSIYLVKYTVDIISEEVNYSYYLSITTLLLFTVLMIGILKSLFNTKLSRGRIFAMSSKLGNDFYAKSMKCSYECLFEKQFLDKRELAKAFTQGGLSQLSKDVINLFSVAVTAILSIHLLGSVDVITIFLILGTVMLESRLLLKKNEHNRTIEQSVHTANRKYQYFCDAACSSDYFKDIKIFGLNRLLCGVVDDCFKKLFTLNREKNVCNNRYSIQYNVIEALMMFTVYALISIQILYFHKPIGYIVIALNVITLLKGVLIQAVTQFGDYVDHYKSMEYYIDYMNLGNVESGAGGLTAQKNEEPSEQELKPGEVRTIEFRNVSFRYPSQDSYALENVSAVIRSGDSIAMIGRNGAGKTTLIKLLLRFYDVTSGKILVNGRDIREFERSTYQKLFTTVFQDFKLFSFTVKENVSSMSDHTDENLLWDSLHKAGLEDKISKLSLGADTYLNKIYDKNGVELSGGEQQKAAFARALYRKSAKVILFDEPAASLDPISEYKLYKQYKETITNHISFFVSHRLSCVNLCSKIMMFEDGKLTAYGTHQELFQNNEEYTRMYNIQKDAYLN